MILKQKSYISCGGQKDYRRFSVLCSECLEENSSIQETWKKKEKSSTPCFLSFKNSNEEYQYTSYVSDGLWKSRCIEETSWLLLFLSILCAQLLLLRSSHLTSDFFTFIVKTQSSKLTLRIVQAVGHTLMSMWVHSYLLTLLLQLF